MSGLPSTFRAVGIKSVTNGMEHLNKELLREKSLYTELILFRESAPCAMLIKVGCVLIFL